MSRRPLTRLLRRPPSPLSTGPGRPLPDLGAALEAKLRPAPAPAFEPDPGYGEGTGRRGPPPSSQVARALSVLVADDARVTLEGLVGLLDDTPDMRCVAAVGDARSAVAAAGRYQPDVALLDVRMPAGGGLEAVLGIREVSPRTRVLAYSAASDRASVVQMLRGGASGYVVKGAPAEDLLAALRRCAAGSAALSEGLSEHLVAELGDQGQAERLSSAAGQARYARIRQLLAPGATTARYQPIVSLATGEVTGYEALARFGGQSLASAEDIFQEAHRVGLGVELELHTARLAVAGFSSQLQRPGGPYLAVNASPGLLYRPALLEVLSELPPGRAVVEITEQRQFESYDQLQEMVRLVHERGLRVAVDDTGSGFAGLQRLVDVRPEIVKLDQALVCEVGTDPSRRAIIAAMRHFADDMGITVVAEGVERQEQLVVLRDLGIDCGQGYLLGRPGPLASP